MKKILLSALFAGAGMAAFAQGLQFQQGDWKTILAKANHEHKLVYVDVATSWCGPCKMMEKNIFPQKEVGDKYNALFINYHIDAEKGEGVEIAKQYTVNGYPTHLFIDPATQAVVYRNMGATEQASNFNHHADVAVMEQQDPMTWAKYVTQFGTGKRDEAFLLAYLQKADRLQKNNDEILNAYVLAIQTAHRPDTVLFTLIALIQTVDNSAVPLLMAHKEVLDARYPDYKMDQRLDRWQYRTFEKAVANKDEHLLKVLSESRANYSEDKDASEDYHYRTDYFAKTDNKEAAFKAGTEEAQFICSKSVAQMMLADAAALVKIQASFRKQLAVAKVPEAQQDSSIKGLMARNPSMKNTVSSQAAANLNDIAWQAYEARTTQPGYLPEALKWSSRSLELVKGMTDLWPSYADTYAHLLYASGRKEEALKTQQEAVAMAKASGAEDAASLADFIQEMKAGK